MDKRMMLNKKAVEGFSTIRGSAKEFFPYFVNKHMVFSIGSQMKDYSRNFPFSFTKTILSPNSYLILLQ
ncbi:hypothetical protein AKG34_01315 [Peribacillus butanolivorans]|nr:hypothetical protein AKG34_01315 [Peribacillus butanolivorans]